MRILLLDGVVELRKPSIIGTIAVGAAAVEPVFVSDLHIRQLKRLRVPIFRTLRAPFCGVGVADKILNFLKSFLNVGFKLRACCDDTTTAEAIAGKNTEHRFHVQILAPLSEFEQPQAVCRPVAPGTRMARALFDRANGFLPVETPIEGAALKIIAAGEP